MRYVQQQQRGFSILAPHNDQKKAYLYHFHKGIKYVIKLVFTILVMNKASNWNRMLNNKKYNTWLNLESFKSNYFSTKSAQYEYKFKKN